MAFLIIGLSEPLICALNVGDDYPRKDSARLYDHKTLIFQRILRSSLVYRILWGRCCIICISFGGGFVAEGGPLRTVQRAVICNEPDTWYKEWGLAQGLKTRAEAH